MLKYLWIGLIGWAVMATSSQAADLMVDDFSSGTVGDAWRIYENTIDTGWRKVIGGSAWSITNGVAQNDSTTAATKYPGSKEAEAPLYNFFSGAGTTTTELTLRFDYSVAAGDSVYVHLWGCTGTSDNDNEFISNIEGSANGAAALQGGTGDTTELTTYNLKDGASSGFGGTATAISGLLTGSGTYSNRFHIADLGIPGVITAADLDYYVIQFAKDEDGLAGTTSIDNLSITTSYITPPTNNTSQTLNYSFLYFENGYPTPLSAYRRPEVNTAARANPDLVVQTGYYSLRLDCDEMELSGYDALAGSDYRTALHEDVTVFTPADLILSVTKDGTNYTCTSGAVQNSTNQLVRLIQSNRFNQRFDLLGLVFEDGSGNVLDADARFEVTAWADRVAFKLDCSGVPGVTETSVKVISPLSALHESTVAGDTAVLAIQPHTDTTVAAWNPGDYILSAYDRNTLASLATSFDADEHALYIDVPADSVSYPADTNRVDEYVIEISNPDSIAQNIPLIFEQPTPRKVTGTVMLMCEEDDGRPIGIPVQISKNWHGINSDIVHRGYWLRGYTMLNLAAGETKQFRLRVIYGYWGESGTISHSQLSLIGWGKNWKWDESALGAWGESCTYDPCLHAGAAFMDDIRPTFTTPMNGGTSHNWTENSGGGDYLVYRDSSNTYRWIKRLKTAYLWTGPNMTEVLYSGTTDDDKIRVTYASRAVRTSDYHRRFHGYTYEFLDDVIAPERLVYHQMAADYYPGPTFTNYFRGDGTGLLAANVADVGGNTYKGTPVQFNNQWLSIDDGMSYNMVSRSRRGIINLSSTLNGSSFPLYMHTYGRSWGGDRMMFDFSADSVERSYSAGDVVEGEFEFIMPPNEASLYWGNDSEFSSRLASYGSNPWNAVYDEFRYNVDLDLGVHEGTLLRNYPVEIQASADTVLADFTVYAGGIGHVPVVVKGVESGLALQAQRWSGGGWVALETADVTENDDYQGVQNPDGTMDVVFNMQRPSTDLNESWRIRIVSGSATDLQDNYGDWIHGYDLNGTNLANTANPDFDVADNLYEYAMGGNPTNPADIGYLPMSGTLSDGGTDWFEYVHARRKNSEGELSYTLENSFNLISNDWNTAAYSVLPTTGNLDADYEAVTNRIDTAGKTNEFIRLKVEAL